MSRILTVRPSKERRDFLDPLVEAKLLSPDGKNWLVTALDPFHDKAVIPTGYPDNNNQLTNVVVKVSSKTITCPGAGAWDCCVAIMPHIMHGAVGGWPGTETLASNSGYINYSSTGQASYIAPVIINSADEGQPLFPDDVPGSWTPTNFVSDACYNLIESQGYRSRVVAWGVEVRNTTAEVYRQGSVMVGMIDQVNAVSDLFSNDAVGTFNPIHWNTHTAAMPPNTVTLAANYPDAKEWEAKEGVYMIAPIHNNNAFSTETPEQVWWSQDCRVLSTTSYGVLKTNTNVTIGEDTYTIPRRNIRANVDSPFAFFTGLSANQPSSHF
jgi:hypothetical protein